MLVNNPYQDMAFFTFHTFLYTKSNKIASAQYRLKQSSKFKLMPYKLLHAKCTHTALS